MIKLEYQLPLPYTVCQLINCETSNYSYKERNTFNVIIDINRNYFETVTEPAIFEEGPSSIVKRSLIAIFNLDLEYAMPVSALANQAWVQYQKVCIIRNVVRAFM